MFVATLADTGTELLITVEHDLADVVVVDQRQDQVTRLLAAVSGSSGELWQAINALTAAGVQRAPRVVGAYMASRCVFEIPPPKAKAKIAARVLTRLLRFEEAVMRDPKLAHALEQARDRAKAIMACGLSINWLLSKPPSR